MPNQCEFCKEGLVGPGESIGSKKICEVCKGTGFSDKMSEVSASEPVVKFESEVSSSDTE